MISPSLLNADYLELMYAGSALDKELAALAKERMRLRSMPESEGQQFALDCNEDAIRYTERFRIKVREAIGEPEITESEQRLMWGDR